MTGTNEKLRALILSALMVFSVFAGTVALSGAAGASAAANVGVTSAVELDHPVDGDDGDVEIVTDSAANLNNLGGDFQVYLNGNNVTSDFTVENTGGQQHELSSSKSIAPTDDLNISIDGGSSWVSVKTTSATVVVDPNNPDDVTTRQGGPVAHWFTNGTNTFFEIEDSSGNQVAGVFASGDNSQSFVIDSNNFETGEDYEVFVDSDADEIPDLSGANFSFRPLTLSTTADSTDITTNDALSGTIDSEAGRELFVELLDSDGAVVATSGTTTAGDGTASYDFGTQATGDYTVRVTDNETGKTATTATITVSEAADKDISFESNTVRVPQGDVAYITINLSNANSGALTIGDVEAAGYETNITFTDGASGSADGQVTIAFNTYTAGETAKAGATASAVDSADSVTVADETQLSDLLAQGDYELGLDFDKQGSSSDPLKVGTIFIQDRSTDSVKTWRGSSDVFSQLSTASDIQDAVSNGDLTESSTFETGDTLVHQVQASGLEGAFNNGSLLGTEATVLVQQQDPDINRDPKTIDTAELAAEIGNDNIKIIHGAGTDSYFIVMDTGETIFERNGNDIAASQDEAYDVSFTVLGSSNGGSLASSDQTVTTTFNFQTGTSQLDQDTYTLQSDSGQQITGTSTRASGTEVTVRIESEDPNNPFVDRQRVSVQSDGTFTAEFDLSDLPEGTNLSVELRNPDTGETIDTATAQIAQPASFEVSNLDAPASAQIGDTVTVTADVTNVGDVEGTVTAEFVFAGDVITSQEVTVAGGATETVTFEIPVSEEIPPGTYEHGVQAGDGSQFAEITIEEQPTTQPPTATPTEEPTTEPPTATPTEEPTTTAEPTTEETTTAEPTTEQPDETTAMGTTAMGTTAEGTDTGTPEDGDGGQPGFGLGIGIVALLAAALLALRRRD